MRSELPADHVPICHHTHPDYVEGRIHRFECHDCTEGSEFDCFYLRSMVDRRLRAAEADRLSAVIAALDPDLRRKVSLLTVWCRPPKGERACRLAWMYQMGGSARKTLLQSKTRRGKTHSLIMSWAFADDRLDDQMYSSSSCRHGVSEIRLPWLWGIREAREDFLEHGLNHVKQVYPASSWRGAKTGHFAVDPERWQPWIREHDTAETEVLD